MASYFVDPTDGDDSNNGTASSTPIKSLRYAQNLATTSGDTITLLNGLADPCRLNNFDVAGSLSLDNFDMTTDITIQSLARSSVVGSTDISHGVTRGNLLKNATFDQWTGGEGTMVDWYQNASTAAGVTKETTNTYNSGATAIKIDGTGGYEDLAHDIWLPAGLTLDYSVACRIDTAGKTLAARFWDRTVSASVGYFDWQAGTWGADGGDRYMRVGDSYYGASDSTYYVPSSGSVDFPAALVTQSTGKHTVRIGNAATQGIYYVDDFQLTPNGDYATYNWVEDTTADVYYVDKLTFVPSRVLVCSESDWQTSGPAAVDTYEKGLWRRNALATCRALENSFYFSASGADGTYRLYVHLEAGADISTLHIEAYPIGAVLNLSDNIILSRLDITGAIGVQNVAGATISSQTECHSINAYNCKLSFSSGAGKMVAYGCVSSWTRYGFTDDANTTSDGTCGDYLAIGASTELEAIGCKAIHSADDGFQSETGGTIDCDGCLVIDSQTLAQSSNSGGSHGFKISTVANSSGEFQNCTAYNINNGSGFISPNGADSTCSFVVDGCVASGCSGYGIVLHSGPITQTVSNSIMESYSEVGTTAFSAGSGNSEADPVLNSSGAPSSTASPSYATGTKWWGTSPRPLSGSGEPYPDIDIDSGGVQSTLSPLHPVNL